MAGYHKLPHSSKAPVLPACITLARKEAPCFFARLSVTKK